MPTLSSFEKKNAPFVCASRQVQVSGIFVILGAGIAISAVYKILRFFANWVRRGEGPLGNQNALRYFQIAKIKPRHSSQLALLPVASCTTVWASRSP